MSLREENYNVMLAELLAERGLRALGEVILRRSGRPTPDVLIELNGVRIIIEGKKHGAWDELIKNCEDRLDKGLCDLCVMVEYVKLPIKALSPSQRDIKEGLLRGHFNVSFISYLDRANLDRWIGKKSQPEVYKDIGFDDLVTYLMSAYEHTVSEDVLQPVIDRISQTLNKFSAGLSAMVDLHRLKEVLELSDDRSESEDKSEEKD